MFASRTQQQGGSVVCGLRVASYGLQAVAVLGSGVWGREGAIQCGPSCTQNKGRQSNKRGLLARCGRTWSCRLEEVEEIEVVEVAAVVWGDSYNLA